MRNRAFWTYTLSDPRTGNARYVGATSYPLKDRLARHCVPAELGKRNHRTNWIRGLQKCGLAPIIEPLEESSSAEEMFHNEEFWIASLLAAGADLVNGDKGGKGRFGPRSDEERRKSALSKLGKVASLETRQKQSDAQKRRHAEHPEFAAFISNLHKGRVDSAETTERRRQAAQARFERDGRPSRPIVHLDTGITYPTAVDCMTALGLGTDRSPVYAVANGRRPAHRGQHFAWA